MLILKEFIQMKYSTLFHCDFWLSKWQSELKLKKIDASEVESFRKETNSILIKFISHFINSVVF